MYENVLMLNLFCFQIVFFYLMKGYVKGAVIYIFVTVLFMYILAFDFFEKDYKYVFKARNSSCV